MQSKKVLDIWHDELMHIITSLLYGLRNISTLLVAGKYLQHCIVDMRITNENIDITAE